MGLVMKNGILLIDYINQLRDKGLGRVEAVLEAGPARLRPVLMTAFSLILGLFPVAFSDSAGSEFRASIGILTIGGMATSTLLTLLVVPVMYTLVDQLLEWLGGLARRTLARFKRPAQASASSP